MLRAEQGRTTAARAGVWAALVACAALCVPGCDGDDRAAVPLPKSLDGGAGLDAGRVDGGRRDGGRSDAGLIDAGGLDASRLDAGGADAAVTADGGPPPANCTVASGESAQVLTHPDGDLFALPVASTSTGFGVVTVEPRLGIGTLLGIAFLHTGGLQEAVELTGGLTRAGQPAIAAAGDDLWLAWVDNAPGINEVYIDRRDATLDAPLGATRLSVTPSGSASEPALARRSDGRLVVVWVVQDLLAMPATARLRAQVVDAAGAPVGGAQDLTGAGQFPRAPVVVPVGATVAVVYVDGADVYAQKLLSTGAADGARSAVSTESNVSGDLDAAMTATGGAAVFGVLVSGRPEVRFRALSADGQPTSTERVITPAPEQAVGPSVAPSPGGFAVSYRATLPTGGAATGTDPALRVAFTESDGEVVSRYSAGSIEAEGGRTTVRAAPDGRFLVTWMDDEADVSTGHLLRLACGG